MLTETDAGQISATYFGVTCTATRLPGEYDANFHLKSNCGKEYLLKVSHINVSRAVIEMQNDILRHIDVSTSSFQVPRLHHTLSGESVAIHSNQSGTTYHVRMFSFVQGKLLATIPQHSTQLLSSIGTELGLLSKSLQQLKHPEAVRYLQWDLLQYQWVNPHLHLITNADERACLEYFLQQFTQKAVTLLPQLRRSIIHGDLNDYNILVSNDDRVTGFIDFGDVVESATICELAVALAYVMMNKPDPIAAATHVVKSFHRVFPLNDNEFEILFDLVCMRLCISVVNSAMRKIENPDDAYLIISEKPAWELLKKLRSVDVEFAADYFRDACGINLTTQQILSLRSRHLSRNVSLSYQHPLHIVKGEGQYLFDAEGNRFLDGVNNVCHVGHCHPRVTDAISRQIKQLNTNTRYVHEHIVRYAGRLAALLPEGLDVCFFVNSGSEANELALRLAMAHTGRNEWLVMDHGYYGSTSQLINMSPYKFNGPGGQGKPDNIHVLQQPDMLRQQFLDEMPPINHKIAALLCESMPSCGGQIVLPAGYLQRIYADVRKAGGVCIADEIQTGLGRMGTHFWAFETQGVVPDIVTMGKPLGNGHPIGAVVTTRAIAESFCNGMEYFNTFGGNPVSCAAGIAVLDVIADENLQQHALASGNHLMNCLNQLKARYQVIGDVRGSGLFVGIELVTERDSMNPAANLARHIVNEMQKSGILLSVDGPLHNVIKIKPPLLFSQENGDEVTANLDVILKTMTSCAF
ncbi:MAG TPA: aminotransferase class III-fold pyridoxal phosphate-dependent enzyme [Gammaproteobacteria bacterium]|nr:aminotransferase class III-fold pyridoxal phosphate-dependent enzyme [Gammaproteobacteria bacterium]